MLTREERREIHKQIGKIQKKLNKERFICLYPKCLNKAILSHSQQREGQLRAIADNGMVYAIDRNIYGRLKAFGKEPALRLKKVGISEASTFSGFCEYHDRELFAPIELKPLRANNREQAFLIYLRSYSYEYLQKLKMRIFLSRYLEKCYHVLPQENISDIQAIKMGMDHFVDDEAPVSFEKLFYALSNKKFSIVNCWWKIINKNILVSSSCCMSPLFEKHFEHRINNWDLPQPIISFNLIPAKDKTDIVFVWLSEFDELVEWINNYDNTEKTERLINHCAFAESEDTCINIPLWEEAPILIQEQVLNAIRHYIYRGSLATGPILVKL